MKKILFMFNQMLSPTFGTGGDLLGREMLRYATKDKDLECSVSTPVFAKKCFPGVKVYKVGDNFLEKHFFNFDKVYTYFPTYIGRSIEFIKKYGELNVDVVYSTGDFLCNTLPAYYLKKKDNRIFWAACIFHINKSPFSREVPFFRGLVSLMMQRLSFFFIKRSTDVIYVLSKLSEDELKRIGFKNKVVVSGAGLYIEKLEKQVKEVKPKTRSNDIVFFNRINYTKGIFDLPEILAVVLEQFPETKLHIIGGGSSRIIDKLKEEFGKQNCVGKVIFHGYKKDKKEIYKIISGCKAFIQPSYEEGWSIVLHEGIICGCIPAVYNLPIYREVFGGLLDTARIGDTNRFAELVVNNLKLRAMEYDKKLDPLLKISRKYDWSKVYLKQRKNLPL